MSIWDRERVPGVTGRHALGLWLTYRKLASAGYVPGPLSRAPLKYKLAAWYPVNFSLAPRLNAEDRVTTPPGFWLVALMGSSVLTPANTPAQFRLQLYDSEKNQRLGDPINFPNELGSAARPWIFRKPYYFRTRAPLLVRVQNQDTTAGQTNLIQVVAMGFGE
jgi:hypothetical protein